MAWYNVDEYSKLEGITIQGVYKRIQKNKVKTMKGDEGHTLVWKDFRNAEPSIILSEANDLLDNTANNQIEVIKDFFEGLVKEIKLAKEGEIETLKGAMETLKEHYDKNEKMKDTEIERLRNDLEKYKDKSFFKRLFGG